MNILDLLEAPFQTNTKEIKTKGSLGGFYQKIIYNPKNVLGHGTHAVVRSNEDPHMVTKTSKMRYDADQNDGFKLFINYIYTNGLRDNPHFPRIYDIKYLKDEHGYHLEKYKMEKLVPGDEIDKNLMHNYVKSVVSPKYTQNLKVLDVDLLASLIGLACTGYNDIIEDPELNKACAIVHDIQKATNATPDVQPYNILFRRTNFGIRVVLSDPLF